MADFTKQDVTVEREDAGESVDVDEGREAKVVELTVQQVFYMEFVKAQRELGERVEGLRGVPEKERAGAVQEIQREIVEWNNKISDSRSFLPGYDLRSYSETLKTLSANLTKMRDSLSSKPKFSFKSKAKVKAPPVVAAPPPTPATPRPDTSGPPIPTDPSAYVLDGSSSSLLTTPPTPCTAIHLTNLKNVLVNYHALPPVSTAHFLRISSSLLFLPPVHGPVHITHMTNSIIILPYAHQVRIHDCKDVLVLYSARSEPVIERCRGMRFGRLPERWVGVDGQSSVGVIQDFDWLKVGKNPHWDLVEGEVLDEELCRRIEECREEAEVESILKDARLEAQVG